MDWANGHGGTSRNWFTAAVCLLGCVYYFFFFYNRAFVELDIEVDTKTRFKLYWAREDQPFSESKRAQVIVVPGKKHYSFYLTDLDRVDLLRIDPFEYVGSGTIEKLSLSQNGFKPITIDPADLEPLNDIAVELATAHGLQISSSGRDPNLLYRPNIEKQANGLFGEAARYAAICLLVILFMKGCAPLRRDFAFVPLLLAMVLSLIVVMAVVSKRNAHPDEYVHLDAAAYYQEHWLPPEIESETIAHTYSVYGISRLNNGEIYYLFAGKTARLLEAFNINEVHALRAFNVLLFGLIFLYSVKSIGARLVALPFLLTPQVWYIFSYCVSDAFGLFLCFLAGCELVRQNSFLIRVVDSDRRFPLGPILAVSALLGMLFLLKINYYPFIVLIYAAIVLPWLQKTSDRGKTFARLVICSLLALLLAGIRVGADYYVNGSDRDEKLLAVQEKNAQYWYKPSTELNKKHMFMYMKDRGTTLKDMILRHKWFSHTFETGFGKYGYFTISGSETYYRLVKWCAILFLAYLAAAVALKGTSEGKLLALLVGCLALALTGASLHRSWTIDFQAQGRYLFPVLPMIGIILARNRAAVDNRVFILITLHLFLLSIYSFVFIALPAVPRM